MAVRGLLVARLDVDPGDRHLAAGSVALLQEDVGDEALEFTRRGVA
jgi:hypothetical protein